ncbi:MAG: competence/damage-inducible protein A [Bacteroidetes bacterium]|nr:competence/damage-inducible protein A [Bacteroidota bacterium]MBU1113877.1 competence/damage-inducible protein A [Bacteroidota bacterium]MBU1798097.1 competence/damage-inducible protein A [Bacteroidota bacterium]
MKAEIITIGDEILSGQTLNTNAAFIGEILTQNHVDVSGSVVVGDKEEPILEAFRNAFDNNDLIIVTGGLGPTHDDLTLDCIVKFFNTELIKSEEVLKDIKSIFDKRNREVTPSNEAQAMVPKIADIIRNYFGTAPGSWIEKDDKIFVSMPGVPFEMKEMMTGYIIPRLTEEKLENKSNRITKSLLTTGIPESYIFERLGDINELLKDSAMAFLPSQFGVRLRITVDGKNADDVKDKFSFIEQQIRAKVGQYIYGVDNDTLEGIIGKLLLERDLTIAVAESCTGGLISARITNISGSSKYFERGIIAYSNGSKVEHFKIDENMIDQYGAVSMEVARLMAEGVKAVSGTDIGLAVTGIMGPGGASFNKPVGLVYIGYCDNKICTAREFHFGDDRILNKDRTSQAALDMLRRNLLGISYED